MPRLFTPLLRDDGEIDRIDGIGRRTLGVLHINGVDYRCVRVRADGRYHGSGDDDAVRFLAVHDAYREVIQKHGPEIYGIDPTEKVVYLEYIEGVSLYKYIVEKVNPWTERGYRSLKEVIDNLQELVASIKEDGFCANTGPEGYMVKSDLSVVQIDFEDIWKTRLAPNIDRPCNSDDSDSKPIFYHILDCLRDNLIYREIEDEDSHDYRNLVEMVEDLLGYSIYYYPDDPPGFDP